MGSLRPDGRTFAAQGEDYKIRLWDTATGRLTTTLTGAKGDVASVLFSPNSKLLMGHDGRAIYLWDLLTGKTIATWIGHKDTMGPLTLAADGRTLASGSADGTILTWDVYPDGLGQRAPTADELHRAWNDLAGEDSTAAHRAVGLLAAAPAATLPFVRLRMPKPEDVEPQRLAQLILDLENGQFQVRHKASEALEQLADGAKVEQVLRAALAGNPSLELRHRLEKLLTPKPATPEQLRWLRVVQALELIGSPDVKPLLETLVREGQCGCVRQDGALALTRLARVAR